MKQIIDSAENIWDWIKSLPPFESYHRIVVTDLMIITVMLLASIFRS